MPRTAGASSTILIDEFNFSGRTNSCEMSIDNNLAEVTTFADDGAEFLEGLYEGTATINGFFDGDDDNYDEQMWSVIGDAADHYVGLYPGNSAASGNIGYELQASVSGQPRSASVAGAVLLNVTWQNNGAVVRATVLDNEVVSTTGVLSGSQQNIGATNAGERFVAVLRIVAWNAASITIDIQQSSDDGAGDAYATIGGMAHTFTALGVQRLSTVSATEAWKQVAITAFSGTSATLIVTVGKDQGLS